MKAEIQYDTTLLRFTPQLLYLQYLLPSASSAAGKLKPPLSPDFDLTQGEDYLIIHKVLNSWLRHVYGLQSGGCISQLLGTLGCPLSAYPKARSNVFQPYHTQYRSLTSSR